MKVGVFAGGFKPFTTGHHAKLLAALEENDLVILFSGTAGRDKGAKISRQSVKNISEIVKMAILRKWQGRVFHGISDPSPIAAVFKLIDAVKTDKGLEQFGLAGEKNIKLTVYGSVEDLKVYTDHLNTPKGELYYGSLPVEGRLSFSSGTDLIGIMCKEYNCSSVFAEQMVHIRASQIRAVVKENNLLLAKLYMPNFLSDDEISTIFKIMQAE